MKKVCLLLAGMLCLSVLVLAGEVVTNDTGDDATGLRVTFSNPVLITEFGDILNSVDPQMLAFDFVFSDGVVEPWGSHWMNWAPATAQIVSTEWLTSLPKTASDALFGTLALGRVPLIVAHRGASQQAPENTIPAFELAWEQGADAIEGDFHQTKDGHIVCIHDSTTGRVANRNLVVSRSTLDSLRQLDVGAWKGSEYHGTVIPTLGEVLATVPEGKQIYIEIKIDESIIPNLLREIDDSGLADSQIVIISFNSNVIKEAKKQAPQYKASWLCGFENAGAAGLTPSLADVLRVLDDINADGLSSSWSYVDESLVEEIINSGYEYHVWTVDDIEIAERFASWGAYSITTNVPGSMADLRGTDVRSGPSQDSTTRDNLINLSSNPTYDEIMSAIAKYPGSDEPIYVPEPDEAIWLTDLEGHADIYDNDSIKINYADWFDQSQISKVEVYRNGIKLRFVPDMLDVLTNEQMKTFDGNPLEHAPASAHTDHAIFGFDFEFRLLTLDSETRSISIKIAGPITHEGGSFVQIAEIWQHLDGRIDHATDLEILEQFDEFRRMGFDGITICPYYYMESDTATDLFPVYEYDQSILPAYSRTMRDDEILRLCSLAEQAHLSVELRVEIWLTQAFKQTHPNAWRGGIQPTNWRTWFDNYIEICRRQALLATQAECDIFTVMVELDSAEAQTEQVFRLLDAVDEVFPGTLCISQQTPNALRRHGHTPDSPLDVIDPEWLGQFWEWKGDSDLSIGLEWWPSNPLPASSDAELSSLVERFVRFYAPVVSALRTTYPLHDVRFSEIGSYNCDMATWQKCSRRDDVEFADTYATFVIGADALDVDVCIWSMWVTWEPSWHAGNNNAGIHYINGTPAVNVVRSLLSCGADTDSDGSAVYANTSSEPDSPDAEAQASDETNPDSAIMPPATLPSEIAEISQAIEVVDDGIFIVDWATGILQKMDLLSAEIQNLSSDFAFVTDIASDENDLIIVSEDASAWTFDTTTRTSAPLDLGVPIQGEVLGVAHNDDTLYLLVYGPTGPAIQAIQNGQSTQTLIQVATAGELISLQMWNGSLLALDYAAGIGYRLVDIGDSYILEQAFVITDYVPAEEQASGGVRGFFLTDDAYYFTSMSQDANPGKLHVVPVAPDPLAMSLRDWDVTDFGTNSGALETVRYGEDDHGSYVAFTNPSTSLNVVLQLWSSSADHDLSAANGFFVDALSLGESTDMFVEFIHDDVEYSEGAIFMNNENDAFTLAESGGLTIALDDLTCSDNTAFPWNDVDGVMLHFRPSTAEIRFYGFRSAIQAAIEDMEK